MSRTSSNSSSESSAAFLEKWMLICEELREASVDAELDSVPLRRRILSLSNDVLASRLRAVLTNAVCSVVCEYEVSTAALLLSLLRFVTSNAWVFSEAAELQKSTIHHSWIKISSFKRPVVKLLTYLQWLLCETKQIDEKNLSKDVFTCWIKCSVLILPKYTTFSKARNDILVIKLPVSKSSIKTIDKAVKPCWAKYAICKIIHSNWQCCLL